MDDTFPKLLVSSPARFGAQKAAFREKRLGIWNEVTWQAYLDNVRVESLGLAELGLKRGDKCALIGSSRREWIQLAVAAQAVGATVLCIYQDTNPREVLSILANSGVSIVIAEDQEQVDKVLQVKDRLPKLSRIVYYVERGMEYYHDPVLLPIHDLRAMGEAARQKAPDLFEAGIAQGSENDPAIVCFTSGLTGEPKPVVLSYRNILQLVEAWRQIDSFRPTDEYVSFLSPAYIVELVVSLGLHLTVGFYVNFPESDETGPADIREIGPHIVVAPPRFWDQIVGTITVKTHETVALKKMVYNSFMPGALRSAQARLSKGGRPALPGGAGEFMIFRPIRDGAGLLRTRLAFNTGGVLSPEVITTLHAIGVPLRQMYGLSEVSGIAAMQPPDDVRYETVGKALPGAEARIADDGEILLRGPQMCLGYLDPSGAVTPVVDAAGWLHTGDAGHLTADGQLVVVDRLQSVIQMSDGTRYSAQAIETRLDATPYIADALVVGQGRPHVTALITIDAGLVGKWAQANSQMYGNYASLTQLPAVYELIRGEVERVNADLPEAVRIRRFAILHRPFSADEGELTRTLKVRRATIVRHYAGLVEALYSQDDSATVTNEVRYPDGRVVPTETEIRVETLAPTLAEVRH